MTERLGFCLLTFADISFAGMGEVTKRAEDLGYERALDGLAPN